MNKIILSLIALPLFSFGIETTKQKPNFDQEIDMIMNLDLKTVSAPHKLSTASRSLAGAKAVAGAGATTLLLGVTAATIGVVLLNSFRNENIKNRLYQVLPFEEDVTTAIGNNLGLIKALFFVPLIYAEGYTLVHRAIGTYKDAKKAITGFEK